MFCRCCCCQQKQLFISHKYNCLAEQILLPPESRNKEGAKWFSLAFIRKTALKIHEVDNFYDNENGGGVDSDNSNTSYLSFFLHIHILSHENFTLGKCVNLRQICPVTKQLSVELHTVECKTTHSTISNLPIRCKITRQV